MLRVRIRTTNFVDGKSQEPTIIFGPIEALDLVLQHNLIKNHNAIEYSGKEWMINGWVKHFDISVPVLEFYTVMVHDPTSTSETYLPRGEFTSITEAYIAAAKPFSPPDLPETATSREWTDAARKLNPCMIQTHRGWANPGDTGYKWFIIPINVPVNHDAYETQEMV